MRHPLQRRWSPHRLTSTRNLRCGEFTAGKRRYLAAGRLLTFSKARASRAASATLKTAALQPTSAGARGLACDLGALRAIVLAVQLRGEPRETALVFGCR